MPENEEKNTLEQNNQTPEKKLSFFTKVRYSITKFEKYPEMAAEGVPSAIKYFVKLMAIFCVIVSLGLVYQFHMSLQSGVEYLKNNLPEMTYTNGELKVESEEAIQINTDNSIVNKVIIDTNTEQAEQIDKYVDSIGEEESGIVVLKDKIIVKNAAVVTPTEYTYTDLLSSLSAQDIQTITKQDIINFFTGSNILSLYGMFFVLMFIYVFIIYLLSCFIDTLVLAILGNITVIFTRLRIRFSAIYNMAVYALTLSITLNAIYIAINTITGFEIKYFQVMYTSIAYIYLVASIFMIKSDFNKRQAELMKIIEAEEIVKQQMQQQEENNNQNDNKKDKEKDDKKDDKETKKEKKGDNETRGSEA